MKKRLVFALMCCFMVLSLSFVLCGFTTANVAHAEEAATPLVIGETYTFSDDGGEYSTTLLSETEILQRAPYAAAAHAVRNGRRTRAILYTRLEPR